MTRGHMLRPHRFLTSLAAASLIVAIGLITAPSAGQGIRSFAPDEQKSIIPAESISLRAVFEALGEETALWYQHVQTLSNPMFEGRAPGTRGHDLTVEYLEWWFERYGLEPAFVERGRQLGGAEAAVATSFQQDFEFRAPNPRVDIERAKVAIGERTLRRGADYQVLGNSGDGKVTAPLAFVGYGISEGPDGYTSFSDDDDLTGRIALLLRYEPLDTDGKSQWSDRRFSEQAAVRRKIASVMARDPEGILFVNPPGAAQGADGLESPESSAAFGPTQDVPIVQIAQPVADELLARADPEGRTLMQWRRLADDGMVKTVGLRSSVTVTIETTVERMDRETGSNVAAVLRGSGDLADEWIIIGGHFDHVGYGYFGSRAGADGRGHIHPGADDNASGTASVLMLAKRLSERYAEEDDTPRRSILFMGFSAEESGLHGSRWFVDNPNLDLEDVSLMINLDMVGRLRDGTLSISGTGTADEFENLLPKWTEDCGMDIEAIATGTGPSDHSNFYRAGVPVLFFFTGLHNEYHMPEDKGFTVNPAGGMKIVDLAERVAWDIAHRAGQLTYSEADAGRGRDRGYAKVRLGIRPGMGADLDTGVLIDEVSEGTSADHAGLQGGDVILQWGDTEITGMRALFESLQKHEPGDVVQLKIQRGDDELTVPVKLQASDG